MKIVWFFLILATSANAADWWQNANFYQIYPRSFRDSDGDGIGDIRGIIEKLDHLKELGVTATWLSPVLSSPQADFGYDISNFLEVDSIFGTNEDLYELFEKAHELGIKVIMDFVPNHTSDEHEWFEKSVKREPGFEDFYVWHNGIENVENPDLPLPPNNWQAVFGTIAWEWHEDRKQYYLHQFDVKQPDLNFRNPSVVDAMKNVLTFWMDMGADGFRIDAINHLFEDAEFRNEPLTGCDCPPTNYGYTDHIYTKDLNETYDMVRQWRELIDEYNNNHEGSTRVIFTEAYTDLKNTLRYYKDEEGHPVSHFPFNFLLIENLSENSNAYQFKNQIDIWLTSLPEGATSNWVLGNHDKPRFASRYGTERVDGMMALLLCLPGVAVTYNGDEIGMIDYRNLTFDQTKDPQGINAGPEGYMWASRDPERTPFQWDDSENAGFSELNEGEELWLPVNPNYETLNLALQKSADKSFFKFYQSLAELRKSDVFVNGDFHTRAYDESILAFRRTFGNEIFFGLINFGDKTQDVNLMEFGDIAPGATFVEIAGSRSSHESGVQVNENAVALGPFDAVILKSSARVATELPTAAPPTDETTTSGSTSSEQTTSSTQGETESSTESTSTSTTDAGCNLIASVVLLVSSLLIINFI